MSQIEKDQSNGFPRAAAGTKILVAGASGGIGSAVVDSLLEIPNCLVGAHGASKSCGQSAQNLIKIQKKLESAKDCEELVAQFCDQAGRLDSLVVLVGGMVAPTCLPDITYEAWTHDIHPKSHNSFFSRSVGDAANVGSESLAEE